ncbi:transglycosylase domain-containing protein [Lactobacillus hominis]|uniref:Membrane carboxypeptidase, penicillin-binding protein 1B n=1 Tax=Lactobacillus hominis DSM 23910 = CRBIP 24.179 TaxID=1423758 RepID=I7L923_9LACO|nr:transglycosylase domain-containing protein [Lactobacillus hominis]KRM85479.1 membrane carboxypeptidase [Lactobacillus hominis DSM 23910 = CRBIP 24.179]MCT3347444.1 penicillin-binding protein [Lactobacillus hominis]CCI81104.1 Membrane carboxypeptidase, penicillin-binding protein 1B [Lactobacillus hominis DSM 23910 = CRBIP 24.179]
MKNLKNKIYDFLTSGSKVSDLAEKSDESPFTFYCGVIYLTLHRIFHYAIVIAAFVLFLLVGFGGGYALGIVRQQSVPTVSELNQQINHSQNSATLYYANNVKLTKVNSDVKIDKASDSEITPLVKKAVTATEDENFYTHHGVLPKSLVRAVISELTGIGVQTGGSTLTQQLVKMQFLTSQTTWRRKVTEMFYAHKIEQNFSKEDILRAYLNAAPYGKNNSGENINGIKTAAQGIFGKSISQLNLAQVAFIAGLPQSPSIYTPYNSKGEVKKDISLGMRRKDIVLFRMYRNGDITKKQYNDAKKYDLKADFLEPKKVTPPKKQNSYLYNLLMNKGSELIATKLIEQDGLDVKEIKKDTNRYNQYLSNASDLLHQKGYKIHSTIRKPLYTRMQRVVKQATLGQDKTSRDFDQATNRWVNTTEHVENGSVVIDNTTGKILAFSGGVDFKNSQVNHAFDTYRSPGSSIKPYLVYGPAIEHGIISSKTALADFPKNFGNYIPTDYNSTIENRFFPAQEALAKSYNLPAVNLYSKLLHSNINLRSDMKKLGLDLSKSEYKNLGLALGGTDYGFSVADNASAFSNFYNDGKRQDPYYIDEITAPTGQIVYKHKQRSYKVFSEGTSYIMQKMLHQVVKNGTASSLNGTLQFDDSTLIGKTGTSNDYRDIWFNGSTPGITISSWMGYDNFYGHSYNLESNASETNLALWSQIANALYDEDPSMFKLENTIERPASVHKFKVLSKTGTLPGTVNFDGEDIDLTGKETTALSLRPAPRASAEFGIGATHSDYQLFYDHENGESNDYGHTLIYSGKTISKKHKLSDLFSAADGTSTNNEEYYGRRTNVNSRESSNTERQVRANDQQARSGQGGNNNAANNGNNNNQTANNANGSNSNANPTNTNEANSNIDSGNPNENNAQPNQ